MQMPFPFFNIALVFFCWVGGAVAAQSTQLHFEHFTTDDGLPSSQTYTVFEDRKGFLWIGTDNGVARFDGYNFKVFDSNDGLDDVVVFTIIEDTAGRIWIGTYSGDIYYLENDRFHAYAHNQVLQKARKENEFVHLIALRGPDSVIVRMQNRGLFCLNAAGEIAAIDSEQEKSMSIYSPTCAGTVATAGIAPIARNFPENLREPYDNTLQDYSLLLGDGNCWREAGQIRLRVRKGSIWPIKFLTIVADDRGNEKIMMFLTFDLIVSEQGKSVYNVQAFNDRVNYVLPESDSTFWIGMHAGMGLQYLSLNADNTIHAIDTLLPGRSVSSITRDRRDGLWVTTLDAGIFYCRFPNQQKYTLNANSRPLSVAVYGKNSFYAGYADGSIFQYDGNTRQSVPIEVIGEFGRRHEFLHFDSLSQSLITTHVVIRHEDSVIAQNSRREHATHAKMFNTSLRGIDDISFSQLLGPRKGLCANGTQFGVLDLDAQRLDLVNAGDIAFFGIQSFLIDSLSRYLVGTINGLKKYDPARPAASPESFDFGAGELSTRIVKIREYQGGLLFATRGEGVVFLRDTHKIVLKERDGLASDMIRDIAVREDGTVWVATLAGLSKIDYGGAAPLVRTYRMEDGLISNEIIDVDTYGGEVWLATNAGIQKFTELPAVTTSPPPLIRSFKVDNREFSGDDGIDLAPGKHNIEIAFGAINFRLGSNVLYRYRLEENDSWTTTADRQVTFPRLGPGEYTFYVASQNEDNLWSTPTSFSFTVGTPWHATLLARIAGFLLIMGATVYYFLRRESIKRRENEFQLQIAKLEHEALHAQMNPHFVFNALNSIQNFVIHNEARQAATYLSRIDLAIRPTLRSSIKGQHSLAEEVNMLTTYLMLEKLRFKEGFEYQVSVAPELDQQAIFLPPLLIQPFVENAIIHGLEGKTETGMIKVSFRGDRELLAVEVEDNGAGFDPGQTPDEESLGMTITRRRLEMMKGINKKVSGMQVVPRFDAAGARQGTRVLLWIYLSDLPKHPPTIK